MISGHDNQVYTLNIILHPLNSMHEDIELKKGNTYWIIGIGKAVKKET